MQQRLSSLYLGELCYLLRHAQVQVLVHNRHDSLLSVVQMTVPAEPGYGSQMEIGDVSERDCSRKLSSSTSLLPTRPGHEVRSSNHGLRVDDKQTDAWVPLAIDLNRQTPD